MTPINHTTRIYYLDYLRGFMILLVVLDHAMHGYTYYFANSWFIQDSARSKILDFFHLHNDAVMMPFMFFLAGLFVFPALQRHGLLSYIKERLIRLGVPLVFGTLFIAPLLNYDKKVTLGIIPEGYGDFWMSVIGHFKTYPLDQANCAGFWFLTYLLILTSLIIFIYKICPGLRKALAAYGTWILQKPVWGLMSLLGIVIILNLISDILWGGLFWFVVPPFMGLRKARFLVKAFFFIMGISMADAGFLNSTLHKYKAMWKVYGLLAFMCLGAYTLYVFTFWSEDLFHMPLYRYVHRFGVYPDFDTCLSFIMNEGFYDCGRTLLLSLTMVILPLFYVSAFSHLNKPLPFWQSLATCSYGIYIFHEPFITALNRYFYQDTLPAELKFLVAASISLGCAWVGTYYLLKIPGVKRVIG